MFYIYNKATSKIKSNPTRGKHYLKAEYKTMAAAKAAMTRMHKKFETNRFEFPQRSDLCECRWCCCWCFCWCCRSVGSMVYVVVVGVFSVAMAVVMAGDTEHRF